MHFPCTQIALRESESLHGVPSSATDFRIAKMFFSAERQTIWQGVTPVTIKFNWVHTFYNKATIIMFTWSYEF